MTSTSVDVDGIMDKKQLAFIQFILDRFVGHTIEERLIINAWHDFEREQKT